MHKKRIFKITERGKNEIKKGITEIDKNYLKQFPEFTDFLNRSGINIDSPSYIESIQTQIKTPQEIIEENYQIIRENLINELLPAVRKSSPKFFEKLVVDLLVTMGYGGSIKEAGQAIGKTGDEGIDGIIKEELQQKLDHKIVQAM
jgi:restriction system protein